MCFLTSTQNKGLHSWRQTKHHQQQTPLPISPPAPENNFQAALGPTVARSLCSASHLLANRVPSPSERLEEGSSSCPPSPPQQLLIPSKSLLKDLQLINPPRPLLLSCDPVIATFWFSVFLFHQEFSGILFGLRQRT